LPGDPAVGAVGAVSGACTSAPRALLGAAFGWAGVNGVQPLTATPTTKAPIVIRRVQRSRHLSSLLKVR